jgi:hypothetical protein
MSVLNVLKLMLSGDYFKKHLSTLPTAYNSLIENSEGNTPLVRLKGA